MMISARQVASLVAFLLVVPAVSGIEANGQQAGTTWVLEKASIPLSSPTPKMRIEGEKLSGTTGCNNFTAKVSERPERRVTIEQVALTRMLCAPEQNKIETALIRALEQTQFIETQGVRLSFLSAQRQPLLVWTRSDKSAANQPLSAGLPTN